MLLANENFTLKKTEWKAADFTENASNEKAAELCQVGLSCALLLSNYLFQ
jgi:hypothetical protein